MFPNRVCNTNSFGEIRDGVGVAVSPYDCNEISMGNGGWQGKRIDCVIDQLVISNPKGNGEGNEEAFVVFLIKLYTKYNRDERVREWTT